MENCTKKILSVKNLKKFFTISKSVTDVILHKPQKFIKAVDDISLDIYQKEIIALVGESGCGKSSFARTIIRLYNPDSGEIVFNGQDITRLSRNNLRSINKEMQMVFQDPYSSLNPRVLIGDMLKDELLYHNICNKEEVKENSIQLMERVGLSSDALSRFPSEFSGGQRQRIGIARAIALKPKFLITDEPVSALDVSIQAQILNLLQKLQEDFGLTILFISHDLRVVNYIADRVAVMYLGKIVEIGDTDEIYENPQHPYTSILLKSSPNLDPRIREEKPLIEGNPPSPIDIPIGCRFRNRCPKAIKICFEQEPKLLKIEDGHYCACHLINYR